MINNLLGIFGLELNKKEKSIYNDFPDIRFSTENGITKEKIIEYGNKDDSGRFYVLTDRNTLIYINDSATQDMIHFGDSSHIVDISEDILDHEYAQDNEIA